MSQNVIVAEEPQIMTRNEMSFYVDSFEYTAEVEAEIMW